MSEVQENAQPEAAQDETVQVTEEQVPAAAEAAADGDATAAEQDPSQTNEEDHAAEEQPVFKPNTKLNVYDKEFEIPEEFQSLMKDKDSEEKIRKIFAGSFGIEPMKQKLETTRQERDQFQQENTGFKSTVAKLGQTYSEAVKTNSWHKMDAIWNALKINPDHIMQYAIHKASLAEMDPAARQAFESRIQAEQKAEELREQNSHALSETQQQAQQMKNLEMQVAMTKPKNLSLAQELETKLGIEGLFQQEVATAGEQAWFNEGKNISVDEAIARVAKRFGLKGEAVAAAATPAAPSMPAGAPGNGKKVVQRSTQTLPNVNGNGNASPVKGSKPRSVEDIQNLYKRAANGEAV